VHRALKRKLVSAASGGCRSYRPAAAGEARGLGPFKVSRTVARGTLAAGRSRASKRVSRVLKVLQNRLKARGGHGRLVMSKSPDSLVRNAAMTKTEGKPAIAAVNELFCEEP
jgi:hypothetical protein